MPEQPRRVLLAGRFATGALEHSYAAAFEQAGCQVERFDLSRAVQRHCELGAAGRLLNQFLPVEPWIHKANREWVVSAWQFQPDIVVAVGQNVFRAGALAQIRAMTGARLVYIWPDTLLNLNTALIAGLPLYDLVATYSRTSLQQFGLLGARHVAWVPLGADPQLHPAPQATDSAGRGTDAGADVAFIGQWRPEREEALAALLPHVVPGRMKIWGPDWGRRCRSAALLRAWQRRDLYAADFSHAAATARINLNIIDATNFPAANMRFFEVPCSGGLQVCSPCPEMEAEFRHAETIFYFHNTEELTQVVKHLLGDEKLRHRVARAGYEHVLAAHTYQHRAMQILAELDSQPRSSAKRTASANSPTLTSRHADQVGS